MGQYSEKQTESRSVAEQGEIEMIGELVEIERRYDGQLQIFRIYSGTRAAADSWAEAITGLLTTWPKDKALFVLHDCSRFSLMVTPHIRSILLNVRELNPEIPGAYGVVFPRSTVTRLAALIFNRYFANRYQRKGQLFESVDEGIAWLEEEYRLYNQPGG
jgi:hypothetical protein